MDVSKNIYLYGWAVAISSTVCDLPRIRERQWTRREQSNSIFIKFKNFQKFHFL
jgi:hypothetical protein